MLVFPSPGGLSSSRLFLSDEEAVESLDCLAGELSCISGRCHLYEGAEPLHLQHAATAVAFRAALLPTSGSLRKGVAALASEACRVANFYAKQTKSKN